MSGEVRQIDGWKTSSFLQFAEDPDGICPSEQWQDHLNLLMVLWFCPGRNQPTEPLSLVTESFRLVNKHTKSLVFGVLVLVTPWYDSMLSSK